MNGFKAEPGEFLPDDVLKDKDAGKDGGKDGRHKKQRCDGGKQQTTNDRPAEWRVLFTAFSQSQSHRNHPDDHGDCGHQNRP